MRKLSSIPGFFVRGNHIHVHALSILGSDTVLEGYNRVDKLCTIRDCRIGRGTYVAAKTRLYRADVGRFCSIGESVKCITGSHPLDFVSTHPAFYSTKTIFEEMFVSANTYDEYGSLENGRLFLIGHDVWIGSRVSLMQGIKIGNGAVIAAGSVVTRDVEPYTVVGGVPAKPIKKRFPDEIIEKLQELKWWDMSLEELIPAAQYIQEPDMFIEYCQEKTT